MAGDVACGGFGSRAFCPLRSSLPGPDAKQLTARANEQVALRDSWRGKDRFPKTISRYSFILFLVPMHHDGLAVFIAKV